MARIKGSKNKPKPPYNDPYTPRELHWMWQKFKGDKDEITLLMDLALLDRNQAIKLSQSYWREYEREQRERSKQH